MRIHRISASSFLCIAIFFCCLLVGTACGVAFAGPAYRRVLTSDASQITWRDGLNITLAVDAERCKKAYGANWSRECAAPAPGKIGQVAKGVTMTPAGATWPYGQDPGDSNIRIAPTYPCLADLQTAMEIFTLCVRISSCKKLIADKQAS